MTDPTIMLPAIKAAGFSYSGIAYLCRVSDRTVSRWAEGKGEPSWKQYKSILELYNKHVINDVINCGGHQAKEEDKT